MGLRRAEHIQGEQCWIGKTGQGGQSQVSGAGVDWEVCVSDSQQREDLVGCILVPTILEEPQSLGGGQRVSDSMSCACHWDPGIIPLEWCQNVLYTSPHP